MRTEYTGPQWPFLYNFGKRATRRGQATLRRVLGTLTQDVMSGPTKVARRLLGGQRCNAGVAHPEAQSPPPGTLRHGVELADNQRSAADRLDDLDLDAGGRQSRGE
jgi:hypothetical protein